jgi:hypothetical protein
MKINETGKSSVELAGKVKEKISLSTLILLSLSRENKSSENERTVSEFSGKKQKINQYCFAVITRICLFMKTW